MTLPTGLKELIETENYEQLDGTIRDLTSPHGEIFKTLRQFREFSEIEFILSLRAAKNEWEEDGIWHDDGSRCLAFSLSLTEQRPQGGVLEIRKKGSQISHKIPTPAFGEMIVFSTGVDGYEHKINKVQEGHRLIAAGWCS